jgi:xanthine dehydrogenase accessory factor
VDPNANVLVNAFIANPHNTIVVDARLLKQEPDALPAKPYLYIGLGPGFVAGDNCDAVVETARGHTMGRVYWDGPAQADSGQPEGDPKRVLRAPADGTIVARAQIGDPVKEGQELAIINDNAALVSALDGVLRGIVHDGVTVYKGMKIGDVDPRGDSSVCNLISDKALAVGGGVLEAALTELGRRTQDG